MKIKCTSRETCEITARLLGWQGEAGGHAYCVHNKPHVHNSGCYEGTCECYDGIEIPEVKCE